MFTSRVQILGFACCLAFGAGCDDPPPPVEIGGAAGPSAANMPAMPAVPSVPSTTGPAPAVVSAGEASGGQLDLAEDDFVETESNRDPFRSYLGEFSTTQKRSVKIQRKVVMQRYGLSELKLIAVVTGGTRPVAMFRDPTGLGVPVRRGDYISKSVGRIKEILSDRVIIEIQEQSEDRQSAAEQVIELHAGESDGAVMEEMSSATDLSGT